MYTAHHGYQTHSLTLTTYPLMASESTCKQAQISSKINRIKFVRDFKSKTTLYGGRF